MLQVLAAAGVAAAASIPAGRLWHLPRGKTRNEHAGGCRWLVWRITHLCIPLRYIRRAAGCNSVIMAERLLQCQTYAHPGRQTRYVYVDADNDDDAWVE